MAGEHGATIRTGDSMSPPVLDQLTRDHFTHKGGFGWREKRGYPNQKAAERALAALTPRGHVYECPHCGQWHLTTLPDRRTA